MSEDKRIKAINDAMSWLVNIKEVEDSNRYNAISSAIEIHRTLKYYGEKEVAKHFNVLVKNVLNVDIK